MNNQPYPPGLFRNCTFKNHTTGLQPRKWTSFVAFSDTFLYEARSNTLKPRVARGKPYDLAALVEIKIPAQDWRAK